MNFGYFDSFDAFLAMDGHGPFVFTVYALGLVVLAFNLVAPLVRRRRFIKAQRARLERARTPEDAAAVAARARHQEAAPGAADESRNASEA